MLLTTSRTLRDILKASTLFLREKEIEDPRLSAEILMAYALGVDRWTLHLHGDQSLGEDDLSAFELLLARAASREPIQYITRLQEFWSLDFYVDPNVLVPRPETEVLIEEALGRLRSDPQMAEGSPKILDLGTGSGVIAVSMAKQVSQAIMTATDISEGAIQVARLNALRHGVAHRIEFRQGDLWRALPDPSDPFDMILSNPPYVASEAYDRLPTEVRDHEPRTALNGGPKGLSMIKRILTGAPAFLRSGGWLFLEMSPEQTSVALQWMEEGGGFGQKGTRSDYSHRERVVFAQRI